MGSTSPRPARGATPVARRRRAKLTSGIAMLTVSVLLLGANLLPAVAQEDDAALPIEAEAIYAYPVTDAIPPTLRSNIPPTAVCVVIANFFEDAPPGTSPCAEEHEDERNQLRDTLNEAIDQAPAEPFHPISPDTVTVSYFGGHTRYLSALQFELPDVPDGEEIVEFSITLEQAEPSYDMSSPAFRQAILSVFASLAEGRDPEVFFDEFLKVLDTDEHPPLEQDEVIGMEACPLTESFEPSEAPEVQDANEDMPTREFDGEEVPAIECLFGANGVQDEGTGRWTFDLTFAAEAWNSGELENNGIMIRPLGAPNLAFGDPDTSTYAQISLSTENVRVASFETAEPFDPGDFGDFEDAGSFEQDFDDTSNDMAFDEGGAPMGFEDAEGSGFAESPEVEDPAVAADEPGVQEEEPVMAQPETVPARGGPLMPWTMWLLVPAFAVGTWLTANALLAPSGAGAAAAGGGGALTRLMSGAVGSGGTPPQQV